jgi:hypothetical protein
MAGIAGVGVDKESGKSAVITIDTFITGLAVVDFETI